MPSFYAASYLGSEGAMVAVAIVTFNKRDFVTVAERFGVQVLSPGEALKLLEIRL